MSAAAPGGAAAVRLQDVEVGQHVGRATIAVHRDDLVRYAAASGDHNPIHLDPATALAVGLPDVIAHGMLTMASAVRVVVDWVGDPAAVVDYGVRFTGQVPVPAEGGAVLEVSAVVGAVDAAAGTVRVDLTATSGGTRVLGRARALVRLSSTADHSTPAPGSPPPNSPPAPAPVPAA